MLEIIIIIYSIYTFLKIYISFMQIGFIKEDNEPVLMSSNEYYKAQEYAIVKEKIAILSNFVDYFVFIGWVFVGFSILEKSIGVDFYSSILFILAFSFINGFISLPFEAYQKLYIDKKYGFNKMSLKLFFVDTLKSSFLFLLIGGAIFAILVWIISTFSLWWLYGFGIVYLFIILANILAPTLMTLFNKFSPLEEGELKSKITKLMDESGLKSNGLFVMDASKRDTRLNAFFGGLGKTKRVVLFDTLIEKLTPQEIIAVLGHELGHFKNRDILKNIALMALLLFSAFYILGNLPDSLFTSMNVMPQAGVQISMLMLMLPLLMFIFTPLFSFVSRHNEYEADKFGAKKGGGEYLVSALEKLVSENKAYPKAHPLVIFFYHTHPPVLERIKELKKNEN